MYTNKSIREEINRVTRSLKEYQPQKIILFGSMARGDFHQGSDMDLLIIKDTERRFVDRISDVLTYVDSSIPIEPIIYTPQELQRLVSEKNSFVLQALQEGEILFEQ